MPNRLRQTDDKSIVQYLDTVAIISESDTMGNITYVNDMFVKISGYSKEELIGKNHNIVNSGFHSPEYFQNLWKTIKSQLVWRGDILNKKKNGEVYWVDSIIFPRFNEQSELLGFMSIRYDITERVRLKEAEIAQYRLRSLGESTAQILHDITSPLMLIDNTLKTIHRKIKESSPFDQGELLMKVEKMGVSSKRISDICRNMQMLMHGTVDQKLIYLTQELNSTQIFLQEKFEKKNVSFEITIKGPSDNLCFIGNSVQFQQVIINLINNSIDAIDQLPNPWIKVELCELPNEVCLSVIDCGLGIDPKIQLKLWESMFTTKDLYKGTGLGLGICKKIVESFKGRILINNDSPNTRFDVFLSKPKQA